MIFSASHSFALANPPGRRNRGFLPIECTVTVIRLLSHGQTITARPLLSLGKKNNRRKAGAHQGDDQHHRD
jgi:hypothetical protein